MDEAGETPENMEALKTVVMEKLGEWYMRNHGVGTMANVEDMCTLLQVSRYQLGEGLVLTSLLVRCGRNDVDYIIGVLRHG